MKAPLGRRILRYGVAFLFWVLLALGAAYLHHRLFIRLPELDWKYFLIPFLNGVVTGGLFCAVLYLYERARFQSYLDPLTGLFNRRYAMEWLENTLKRLEPFSAGGRLSIVLLDIDDFKNINDTFAHHVGDQVLRTLAGLFREEVRLSDLVCRVGGEEFLIIMPRTDRRTALEVAERIRSRVAEFVFPTVGRVTVSAGVASLGNGMTLTELLIQADLHLYRAKDQGKNRVYG